MTVLRRPVLTERPPTWGTAEDLPAARRYLAWITELLAPHLGDRPLLLAAGSGEYAAALAADGAQLTVSEQDEEHLARLRTRFAGRDDIRVARVDLDTTTGEYSAVVALNMLEHVDDDERLLRRLRTLVVPGGTVVVMVPAFRSALSSFERRLGHRRRYRMRELVAEAGRAGLLVRDVRYFNALGLIAWMLGVRVLRLTPKPGPMLTAWDRLGVPLIQWTETRWPPPFGKELFLLASTPA